MEVKFQFDKIARINKKKIKCPTCKNKAVEPYIPFCSVKCSDIDLMKWLIDDKDKDSEGHKSSL